MKNGNSIVVYLLAFVLFAIALKLLGMVLFNNYELLAVIFTAYGAGTVYSSMGRNKKFDLFIGTAAFLTGVVFLLIGKTEIFYTHSILFTAVLLIIGISSLMLFFDDTSDKTILIIGSAFLILGYFSIHLTGNPAVDSFFFSLYNIASDFWMVIIVVIIAIILVSRTKTK